MINKAEGLVIGQVAGPPTLFQPNGRMDRNTNEPLLVLKVPVYVNQTSRQKDDQGNSKRTRKAFQVTIWGKKRILNFLQHCPKGTHIYARGPLNHDGRKTETGFQQFASVNATELIFGQRSQKGMAETENSYYVHDKVNGGRVLKTIPLRPVPANARARAPQAAEHQVPPATVEGLESLLRTGSAGGQGAQGGQGGSQQSADIQLNA